MRNVLDEIDAERVAQLREYGGQAHDDEHTPAEWVAFIVKQLGAAVESAMRQSLPGYRARMIKIAALAVAVVESVDRAEARAARAAEIAKAVSTRGDDGTHP